MLIKDTYLNLKTIIRNPNFFNYFFSFGDVLICGNSNNRARTSSIAY